MLCSICWGFVYRGIFDYWFSIETGGVMFKQYFSWRNITIFGDVIVIWTIIVGLVNAPWPGEAAFVALVCIVLVYHWYQAGGFQWIRKKNEV